MLGAAGSTCLAPVEGHHATYNLHQGASVFSLLSRLAASIAHNAGARAPAARSLRSSAFAVLLGLRGVRPLNTFGALLYVPEAAVKGAQALAAQAEYDEVHDRAKANSTALASVRTPASPHNTST